MGIVVKVKNVIRSFKQTMGTSSTRRKLWDSEYASGRWNKIYDTPGAFVYKCIEKYCHKGRILDMGCGSGNTGNELNVECYSHYLGVDVSEVATRTAAGRSAENGRAFKTHYVTGDIFAYAPPEKYDLILFRESIYYLGSTWKIKAQLIRYSSFLSSKGVFLVTLGAQGTKKDRISKIDQLIEDDFEILERCSPPGSEDVVLVFKPR